MKNFDIRPAFLSNDVTIPGTVAWTEGLQLLPQHFQVTDSYFAGLLFKGLWSTNRFFWGFYSLDIDHVALSQGILRINSASGVFPCGVMFDISPGDIIDYPLNNTSNDRLRFSLNLEINQTLPLHSAFSYSIDNKNKFSNIFNLEDSDTIFIKKPKISIISSDSFKNDPFSLPCIELNTLNPASINLNYHPPSPYIVKDSLLYEEIGDFLLKFRSQLGVLQIESYPTNIQRNYINNLMPFSNIILPSIIKIEGGLLSGTLNLPELYNACLHLASSYISFINVSYKNTPLYNHLDPYSTFREIFDMVYPYLGKFTSSKSIWKRTLSISKENYFSYPVDINSSMTFQFCIYFENSPLSIVSNWIEKALICWESDYNKSRANRVKGFSRVIKKIPDFPLPTSTNSNILTFEVQVEKQLYSTDNFNLIIEKPSLRNTSIFSSIELITEVI